MLAEAEKGPGSFPKSLDQPGFGQEPQMPGNARLRLAQDVGEIGHRQFRFGQKRQNAQPSAFGDGPERAVERRERKSDGWPRQKAHGRSANLMKPYIRISLYL